MNEFIEQMRKIQATHPWLQSGSYAEIRQAIALERIAAVLEALPPPAVPFVTSSIPPIGEVRTFGGSSVEQNTAAPVAAIPRFTQPQGKRK